MKLFSVTPEIHFCRSDAKTGQGVEFVSRGELKVLLPWADWRPEGGDEAALLRLAHC